MKKNDIKPYELKDYKKAYDMIKHIMDTFDYSDLTYEYLGGTKSFLANIICDNIKDGEIIL